MTNFRIKIRDWWRGYTNEDIAAALRKTEGPLMAGSIVEFSGAEYLAWRDLMRSAQQQIGR